MAEIPDQPPMVMAEFSLDADEVSETPTQEVSTQETEAATPEAPAALGTYSKQVRAMRPEKAAAASKDYIHLPPATVTEIDELVSEARQVGFTRTEEAGDWLLGIERGTQNAIRQDGLVSAVTREGGEWTNAVDSAQGGLGMGYPRHKVINPATASLDTIKAVIRAQRGLGNIVNIPLWHSGFWVRLQPPEEYDLLDLHHAMVDEKKSVGRFTNGLIFSHTTAYMHELLFQFILRHIQSTSLKITNMDEIGQYIKLPDLKILIWGMAAAQYCNGFNYERSCVGGTLGSCKHIDKDVLDLTALQYTDVSQLSKDDIRHMSIRETGKHSIESVVAYQERNYANQPVEKVIDDQLTVRFKMCNVLDSFAAAHRWIDAIEEMSTAAVQEEGDRRAAIIADKSRATVLRQWGHLINAVIYSETEYSGAETVAALVDDFSALDDLRPKIHEAAKAYVDSRVISMIGFPTYDCPACGQPQRHANIETLHPDIIPLDPLPIFFQLSGQRLQRIRSR